MMDTTCASVTQCVLTDHFPCITDVPESEAKQEIGELLNRYRELPPHLKEQDPYSRESTTTEYSSADHHGSGYISICRSISPRTRNTIRLPPFQAILNVVLYQLTLIPSKFQRHCWKLYIKYSQGSCRKSLKIVICVSCSQGRA